MKKEKVITPVDVILRELQTIITIFYLLAVGIGMLFKHRRFAEFNINIFEYADLFDFLIAPFSDFYIIIFATGSILIVSLLYYLDSYWQKKWPGVYSIANFGLDKKSWFKLFRTCIFSFSLIIYLYSSAIIYGRYIRKQIDNSELTTIVLIDGSTKEGKLIGKSKDMIFILRNGRTIAIPVMSVVKEIWI